MIEGDKITYLNFLNKQRIVSVEVAHQETQARRKFLDIFIPQLHRYFQRRGVEVLIEVIGSVAADAAIETSDIDLLVREAGTEDLERVRKVGVDVIVDDIRETELPFKMHFWFDHPVGSAAYERQIKGEEAEFKTR